MPDTENALQGTRVEWAPATYASDYLAEHPSDPDWNKFGDNVVAVPGWSPEPGVSSTTPVGQGYVQRHDRGAETHGITVGWQMQRFPVAADGSPNDPLGALWTHEYTTDFPAYSVVARRAFDSGGNFDAGYRDFTVALGAKPTEGTVTGDPSDNQPQPAEVSMPAQKVRSYLIHQPDGTVTPELVSTDDSDTFDVVIEDEGASTTDTVALTGTTSVTAGESFGDIDAIYAAEEPTGDISVTDGSGTDLLEAVDDKGGGLRGTANDNRDEGDRGVPPLGAGSHASDIGADPGRYVFNGGQAVTVGGSFDARLHGSTITVSADATREPLGNGTSRQAIDVGPRTTQVELDSASRYRTHTEIERLLHGLSGDVVVEFPDGTFTAHNAQVVSTGERNYEAGQANVIVGSTFEAEATDSGTEITATNAGA
jgi:hypothetical protein